MDNNRLKLVKNESFTNLITSIVGKKCQFTSTCEFFPNFNVQGLVHSYYIKGNELIFKMKTLSGKNIDIGSNMKELKYRVL